MNFIGQQKSWLKFRIKSEINDFQLIKSTIFARTNERVNKHICQQTFCNCGVQWQIQVHGMCACKTACQAISK